MCGEKEAFEEFKQNFCGEKLQKESPNLKNFHAKLKTSLRAKSTGAKFLLENRERERERNWNRKPM